MEAGIDPASWKWRIAEPFLALQYKRWLIAVLDALPAAILRATLPCDQALFAGKPSPITTGP